MIFEEGVSWSWDDGDVSLGDFHTEEDVASSYDLGEPSGTGEIPVEVGASAIDSKGVDTGGNPVDSTQGENSPQGGGEPPHSTGSDGALDLVSAQGSEVMQEILEGSGVQGDYSSDDEPERFRSLTEIYADTDIVELQYDSDGEALLADTDEPNCYFEAAGNPKWIEAMDKEI